MISKALKVQFIAVNTDKQALERCQADVKVQIGNKVTRGLGAGGDWTRGRDAADESRTELGAVVQDSDMVFITAGMGGGTGTGSASIVAEMAKEAGALTIGVVTRPFGFEGRIRNDTAEEGIKALRGQVDALIVIPNDRLAQVASSKTTLQEVQKAAEIVRAAADPGANIIFGVVRDDTMAGEIKITVIATGFGGKTQQEARQETARRTIDRPELGLEELGDINIPAFLRNRM